jgi:hypothetical protein
MSAQKAWNLRPRLEEAQKALDAALEEACETDIQSDDISQLMRLEERLTVAREAANNVITTLQQLVPEQRQDDAPQRDAHRVFVDDRGVQWDAFAVYPSRSKGRETLPPPYDQGWLAIQCPEGIRRLTPIPQGWQECSRDEFCRLLESAPLTPRRTAVEQRARP